MTLSVYLNSVTYNLQQTYVKVNLPFSADDFTVSMFVWLRYRGMPSYG